MRRVLESANVRGVVVVVTKYLSQQTGEAETFFPNAQRPNMV